ncbi:MAG: cation transporter [Vicinamibacteria bacterium]|nr:cation transporter [Vicinamibacteria bacterium]
MTHDHNHANEPGHVHAHAQAASGALARALVVTLGFAFVEAVVGVLSGSLALLSDAAHMLVDSGALGLALFAQRMATRPRTASHTFGYRRAEVIAAAVSGGALFTASIGIIIEAFGRLRTTHAVRGDWMLATAVAGLLINIASGVALVRGAHASINVRAALAHVVADAMGSVAAIVASIAVLRFGFPEADALASILISILILWGAWKLMRESAAVLMEQAPPGVSATAIEATIRATPGVRDLHDLHVWTISDGFPVVTVHVVLSGEAHGTGVAHAVAQRVTAEHGIEHVTVQPEAVLEAEAPLPMKPRPSAQQASGRPG